MRRSVLWLIGIAAMGTLSLGSFNLAAQSTEGNAQSAITIVDTHTHLVRNARKERPAVLVSRALRAMDDYKIELAIILPPPFPPNHAGTYGRGELRPVARDNRSRFAFASGGEGLNPIIHKVAPDKVTPEVIRDFQQEAETIVEAGAAGFGELTAEHFSSGQGNHPYESTRPDHPLFLILADIAARNGMPIDLHMEAVPQDMPFPRSARGPNPESLKENISGFERLLAHNPNARIIWAHAGWDLTGERTVALMRSMLEKHPNLYMSIKLRTRGPQRTSPFDLYGGLRPDWLGMLRDYPDRFVIGSDQFFDDEFEALTLARKFVDALPPDLAHKIARENALRIYRLGAPAR